MKCSDARPLLDLLSDNALEAKDSAIVLDHLKSCEGCQNEWHDLERLHSQFYDAKEAVQLPIGLMGKISESLKDEERNQRRQAFGKFAHVPLLSVAATVLLVGILLLPMMHQSNLNLAPVKVASADVLVENLASNEKIEAVSDKNELAKKVGYELKHVHLPDWQMSGSGVCDSSTTIKIARFDFVRKRASDNQRLSCYQAPQGTIQAQIAGSKDLEGKHVLFGKKGNFQYALWSQNGRDYLFVTPLTKPQLEEIVRGA